MNPLAQTGQKQVYLFVIAYSRGPCPWEGPLLDLFDPLNEWFDCVFRCLAICKPLWSVTWRTTKRAKVIIALVYVVSVGYGGLLVYTTSYRGPRVCVAVGKNDSISRSLSWIMLLVNSVFPFISILVMNVMILAAIRRRPKSEAAVCAGGAAGGGDGGAGQTGSEHINDGFYESSSSSLMAGNNASPVVEEPGQYHLQPTCEAGASTAASTISLHLEQRIETTHLGLHFNAAGSRQPSPASSRKFPSAKVWNRKSAESTQLAVMLLTVSFAFLILTLPLSVRSVIYALGFFRADSAHERAQTALVVAITSRVMLANAAVNFWLYSVAGKKFREDLMKMMKKCARRCGLGQG